MHPEVRFFASPEIDKPHSVVSVLVVDDVFSPLFPIYWPLPPVQAHSVLKPEQQDRMRIKKRWKPVLRDCCKQLTSVCWKVSEGGRIWKTSLQKLLKRRRIGAGWIVLKSEPDDLFQPAQIIKLINHNTD